MGKYTFPSRTTSISPDGSLDAPTRDALGRSEDSLPLARNAPSQLPNGDAYDKDASLTDRYKLQHYAAKLLPKEAVSKCHFSIIGSAATLLYIPSTDSAAYANIETCHSVWVCSVCGAKISLHRKNEIDTAVCNAKKMGLKVVMLTLTFSHHRGDSLEDSRYRMIEAYKSMQSGRFAKDIKEQFGIVGYIRAVEVTYSDENGWHPHMHVLVFLSEHANVEAYGEMMRARWESSAKRCSLSMNGHGFRLDSTDSKIADYIAKFGREPGEKTRQAWESGSWNEASELTQWHRKRGYSEHYTPFDLLRFAGEGDESAGALFQEYARVFKGKKQLFWSPGLRELLGLNGEKTDEEIVEEHENDKQEVAALHTSLFYKRIANRQDVKKDARSRVLNATRKARGDIEVMTDYLVGNFDALRDDTRSDIPLFYYADMPIANDYEKSD